MKSPVSYQARRELVEQMAPQYREWSRTQKMLLLLAFVAMTGSVRKYAMWLLNHPVESRPGIPHTRPVHYRPEVQQALLLAWKAANQICPQGKAGADYPGQCFAGIMVYLSTKILEF